MECDDKYIYFLQHDKAAITVHDWDGNQIKTIMIEGIEGETEGIFIIGNTLYITTYHGYAKNYCVWTVSLSAAQ